MKLVKVDPSIDLGGRSRVTGPIIEEFLKSSAEAMEVTEFGDRRPDIVASMIRSYIDRHDSPIKIVTRGQRIFLVRR